MDASIILQSKHGVMVDDEDEDLGSMMPSSSSESSSIGSSTEDFIGDATSSTSSSSPSSSPLENGPLYDMSSLMTQLPIKRGLSQHYQGKAQSFASLSVVTCLEDLAKPERPYNKRLKASKSCGGGLENHRSLCCSKVITKKGSRGSFTSLGGRRHSSSLGNNRPPIPPQRSNNISNQTLLYA